MAQINKPDTYFNTKLYTGDGTNPRAITGVGFQPDLVWNKPRSAANSHALLDSVRGATKFLSSDVTDAEYTYGNSIQSFDSDGFTCGDNASFNQNGTTYASWNWLGANGTAANTDGSISSTVSASTTSGFSIVSYTGNGSAGATVGHGLGSTPKMIIVKRINTAAQWNVYHESLGNTGALYLNDSIAFNVVAGFWNNTSPNSTTFTLGTDAAGNGSGDTYIAYCFAEKQGFSKFGSYTGNGSTDGTFVYTGFKPAFVICKRTTTSGYNWILFDNKREGFNLTNDYLQPNTSDAEIANNASQCVDFLSNGFKHRGSGDSNNASNVPYIYMAFAEEPLVGDNPATAR